MEIVVAILAFVAFVIVAVLVFGGWMIVAVVRLLARAIGGGAAAAPVARPPPPPVRTRCSYVNCRAGNAPSARFCRRCGRGVTGGQLAVVRRVAMW